MLNFYSGRKSWLLRTSSEWWWSEHILFCVGGGGDGLSQYQLVICFQSCQLPPAGGPDHQGGGDGVRDLQQPAGQPDGVQRQ